MAYLIVSDLHLCNVENNIDGWKNYKNEKFKIDSDFKNLLDKYKNQEITLILNGDIIDFDLIDDYPKDKIFKISRSEKKRGLDPTEEKSLWKLKKVMDNQKEFFKIIAEFLSKNNNKIVYILGNHDRELYFKSLQNYFVNFILNTAKENNLSIDEKSIVFEEWFYFENNKIYVEHGNQYDYYTSFKYILEPTIKTRKGEMIALPMGDLSNRYLLSNMGFFNPHASDYILSGGAYFMHWFTKYAFTKRGLVLNWILGSIKVFFKLLYVKQKLLKPKKTYKNYYQIVADKYNLSLFQVETLLKMHRNPIIFNVYRIVKEFWLDRLFLMMIYIGATISLALVPIPLWIKLMVPLSALPLLFFIYEKVTIGETIFSAEEKIPHYAKRIAQILNVKYVIFGHTHKPRLIPILKETTFLDTGTWAPIFNPDENDKITEGYRNYIFIDFSENKETVECKSLT